jgi:adenine deaminase
MRRFFRGLLLTGLVLAIGIVGLAIVWWPPSLLRVSEKGAVLADVTVINPSRDRRVHQTVTIHGSTIASIADFRSSSETFPQTQRCAGAYVLPGQIDMHVHHPPPPPLGDPIGFPQYVLLFLAYGVTTVRDAGDPHGNDPRHP